MSFIPSLPGVPPLFNQNTRLLVAGGAVLFADVIRNLQYFPIWGIYNSAGSVVLQADTVIGFGYQNNWAVSDYPVEQGAFSTYNKVATPFGATITMVKGGTTADRETFLKTLDSISGTLDLYTIVTPEQNYTNATIERYDFERRTNNGANIIVAHIRLREVRITPPIQYANTRSGQQLQTNVPASAQTNPNTSTGLASPTATATPNAQAIQNQGQVSATTSSTTTQAAAAGVM